MNTLPEMVSNILGLFGVAFISLVVVVIYAFFRVK